MEERLESLSREEPLLESPSWHEEELRKTAARLKSGEEESLDWSHAKRELRKRAESASA